MALVFARLNPAAHDRASFSCGDDSLDSYLKRQALQDMRRRISVCYVLHEEGQSQIVGYYTLSALAIEPRGLPQEQTVRLPRYPQRSSEADIAVMALVVDAIDERAAAFYRHYGFVASLANPLRLYLMLGPIRGRA